MTHLKWTHNSLLGMIQSKLIGQEESLELLEKVLDDPPHLFFSGGYGSGKTTLLHLVAGILAVGVANLAVILFTAFFGA